MNIPIQQYLPHRAPMQMVDTITNISSTHVVTEFTISSFCRNRIDRKYGTNLLGYCWAVYL